MRADAMIVVSVDDHLVEPPDLLDGHLPARYAGLAPQVRRTRRFQLATRCGTFRPVKRTDTSDWPCTIARSVNVLGDRWSLLIIRQACLGTRRFDVFQAALGTGRNILSQRLARLVDEGLLARVEYQDNPPRYEYRLTDKGRDVYPILAAMAAWGEKWLTGPEGTPLILHHNTCGHDMSAVVVCSECTEPLDVRVITAKPGPGLLAGA